MEQHLVVSKKYIRTAANSKNNVLITIAPKGIVTPCYPAVLAGLSLTSHKLYYLRLLIFISNPHTYSQLVRYQIITTTAGPLQKLNNSIRVAANQWPYYTINY